MNQIIATAIKNKRMVLTTLLLIFIIGTSAYVNIAKEDNPDVPIPFFAVTLIHDGISPEDAERLLIKPTEVQLRTVKGVKEMTSIGREGSAVIYLEFDAGFDNQKALLDVRDAVDKARSDLPSDTEEPIVSEFNASEQPILSLVVYGDASERLLIQLAKELKEQIEAIPNVLEVEMSGDREEVLEVLVDPARLVSYNVTQQDLLNVIRLNNRLVAAGSLDTGAGRFAVKLPGLFESPQDVLELPIKSSGDGVVTLGDITDVRRTFKDQFRYARMNGKPAITLEISKRVGTNVIETSQMVHAVADKVMSAWPAGIDGEYMWDSAEFIEEFQGTLENSVLSAIVLVAIIIVAALGLRSASLVGMAIPGAFLFGIMLLWFIGFTINTVVMFGLILSVGLLVDGAIVVSEYADRKMLEGFPRGEAYKMAAQRMAWPITSSTLTTLAAFFPLLFWPTIIGEWMKFLPMTLIFTLIGSLLMALIFLPTLGSLLGKPGEADPNLMWALSKDHELDSKKLTGATGVYVRLLQRVIKRPGLVVFVAVATLFGLWISYAQTSPGTEFFPQGDPDTLRVNVHARGNLSPVEMRDLVAEVENRIVGIDGIKSRYSVAGPGLGGSRGPQDIVGRIQLMFEDWQDRPPASDIIAQVRERTEDVPGVVVEPVLPSNGPTSGKDIQIEITSENPALIMPVLDKLRAHLENEIDGVVDVDDNRSLPGIEWRLEVNRAEASRYGTDIVSIGSAVQLVTNGIKMGEVRFDDAIDEMDIRVRFPLPERGINQLDNLMIPTAQGSIPISNFVKRVPHYNVTRLMRIDSERVSTLNANVAEGVLANNVVDQLKSWIDTQRVDPRVKVSFGGNDELQQESSAFLMNALIIAMFIMFIILITQFNSFYQAVLVLSAVIMSTVGVVFGLLVTGKPFVIVMTGVGIIALAGIVVNNNIVLIDTFDRHVKEGIKPLDAIILTGAQRLRPVFLTTATTIIGLMPMVFQFNVDFINRSVSVGSPTSFIWVDLAQAIAFGLAFATVLTLIVTPCLLALPTHLRERRALRKERRALKKMRRHPALDASPAE